MSMTDLNVGILVRLIDQFSGPGAKLEGSLKRLKAGSNELRQAFGARIKSGFSEDALAAKFERSEARIRSSRARLVGAFGMGLALAAPVIVAGNFEEKLIDFANLAEIDKERVVQLQDELNALRSLTGQSNVDLLDGLATYVGKGMDLDDALASLGATGRAAKATKSQFDQMANSGYAVMDNLGVLPVDLRRAFDIMAKSGKEGSFELAAMARKFPEITAGAKSLKMDGVDAVASLSAALQIAMKSAGSEDQAATNMTNFLGKITAPDTVAKFQKFGVDIEREMQIALARGADPLEHMLLVIKEMTGGDAFKMSELFADKQVLDFLRAMIPNMEEYQRIKAEALGADGVVDADWDRVMKGFNEQWRQLKNSTAAMLSTSGSLLPVLTDIMGQVRSGVEWVTAWTSANPELTATIVKGTAALLAFGIATRVIGYGVAVMSGGLLRTASLFLKFDKNGKNISLIGRSARLSGRGVAALFRSTRGLVKLMSAPMRWAITPLKWTAKLIPNIPWAKLVGKKLALSALIVPLKWTSKLLPSFAPALARFVGFRAAASTEITKLSSTVAMQSASMRQSLSRLRWSAFGAGVMAWSAMQSVPEDPEERKAFQRRNVEGMENTFRATPGLGQLMGLYDSLFEKIHGMAPPSATASFDDKSSVSAGENSSGTSEAEEISAYTSELTKEISALKDRIANIKDGPLAETLKGPMRQELAQMQQEMSQLVTKLGVMVPLSQAIRTGQQAGAVETSIRPTGRPTSEAQAYQAPQPNVTVESTFESNPKISVAVTVPVHITRQQKVDNAAIARAAGAQAEQATRRGLDDAAIAEE